MLVAFDSGSAAARGTKAHIYGDRLTEVWSGSFSGTARAVDCRGGTAALLMPDRLEIIRTGHDTILRDTVREAARDVVVSADGDPILIYSDRAEKVPEEE